MAIILLNENNVIIICRHVKEILINSIFLDIILIWRKCNRICNGWKPKVVQRKKSAEFASERVRTRYTYMHAQEFSNPAGIFMHNFLFQIDILCSCNTWRKHVEHCIILSTKFFFLCFVQVIWVFHLSITSRKWK